MNWIEMNATSFEGDGSGDSDGSDAVTAAATGAKGEGDGSNVDTGTTGTNKTVSDSEARLLKEVMEKKDALNKAKEAAKALETEKAELASKLAKFDGIDLEQVKTLLKERQEREHQELEKRGEWDKLKSQMVDAHMKELELVKGESTTKVQTLESELTGMQKQIHELTIGRSFSESPFIREGLTLTPSKARVIYGGHFELQDGKVIAYDKPAGSSDRTMLINGDGNPLEFDKAIEKLVELDPDRDNLLRSKMKSGSGSSNDADARGGKSGQQELRGKDRILAAVKSGALKQPSK